MKNNGILDTIIIRFEELELSELRKFVIISVAAFGLLAGFVLYKISSYSGDLIKKISKNQSLSKQATDLLTRRKSIESREFAFASLCEEKSIPGGLIPFLNDFFRENAVNPASGWQDTLETIAVPKSDKFEEQRIQVSFRGQTTEQMVNLLDSLYNETMVMIREIEVNREGNSLKVNLLIATRIIRARA
ncbi:hypothetical protein ACFLY6_01300 [Candidatus Dependentiae bacterium]